MIKRRFGHELILDYSDCSKDNMTREGLGYLLDEIMEHLGVTPMARFWWDDESPFNQEIDDMIPVWLQGTTVVQFLLQSNITIHTLNNPPSAYVNIFSCKEFNDADLILVCNFWFKRHNPSNYQRLERGWIEVPEPGEITGGGETAG